MTLPYGPVEKDWFKDAIIYELHIKAFKDSNKDGIGDFGGLIEKMDYLQDLGVTALWLLPFYPSPQRDGGYDIADYYQIHPNYGTLDQFKQVLEMAHERGMQIITELVINHTSDAHPWFERARRAPKGSPARNWYVWTDDPATYPDVRIIFQDYEHSNWTWDPVAGQYYWHRFYSHQPDLNYDHLPVQEEIFRIIDFWAQMGVDGFRLDAIPYLFEREGTNCENLPETHAFLKKLRQYVDKNHPHVLLLAEANMWPEDAVAYFGNGDECHMNYHFPIMPRMFMAVKMEDRYPIIDIIDQTPKIPENCQWGIFLRNHDELTLEMVTDEERDYMYRAYNKDENSRINLGIRHRLAPLLDNHRQKIELLNILLFSLPGTPIIYYGDEIGMGDNVHLGDRDGVRTPMQWNLDRNAGFSDAHPHKLYLPLINDPEYHHTAVNVEVQEQNNALLLWWMKRLIRLRKRYKAFGRGDIQFLSPENPKVLAFTRSYKDEHLLIIANLSRHPQVADLQLPGFEGYQLREVFGRTWFPSVQRGANRFTLGAYGYYWFALETAANEKGYWQPPETVAWPVRGWTEKALLPKNRAQFTSAIRMYIERSTLYGAPLRLIDEVAIHAHQILHWQQNEVLWLVVEVRFTEGFPEYYSLPVIGLPLQQQNGKAALSHPDTILLLEQEEERGYLADASGLSGFQAFLLTELLSQSPGLGNPFHIERTITKHPENLPLFKVQTIEHGGTNRTLAFGETYFLKLYSRLSTDTNPDLEVSKMAKEKGLPAPGYLGHLSLENPANKQPWVLALLQPYVKNQGTAFMHFQDACRRYLEEVMSMQEVTGEWPKPHLAIERAAILGQTIAQLHQGLTDKQIKGFSSEPFSLHYQRSLFAGMQSQLRQTFNRLDKVHDRFSQGAALLQQKDRLLQLMKTVYDHPVSGLKIRIHGDLHLNHVLFDGKDFIIYDFEGERERQYSALRLRKAPYRDLACLLSSFFFVTIEALKNSDPEVRWKNSKWLALAEYWFKEVSRTLIDHYHEAINPSGIIPENRQDSQTMLRAFFIDRLLYDLNVAMVSGQKQESTVIYALLTIAETDEWWAIR